jgi:hypothetical protein
MHCGVTRQGRAFLAAAAMVVLAAGLARAEDGKSPSPVAVPPALHDKGCSFFQDAKWANGKMEGMGAPLRVVVTEKSDGSDSKVDYIGAANLQGGPWDRRIGAMRCDNTDQLRCQAQFFSEDQRKGEEVTVWANYLITLREMGWNKKASSLLVGCAALK